MKKTLFLLAVLLPGFFAKAQSLQNPGFENWINVSYDEPDGWFSTNQYAIPFGVIPNVSKLTPGVNNSGIRLESMAAGTDVLPGFIWNGTEDVEDALDGYGGMPFSDKPTTLSGYFRYNIPATANASIIVIFKNSGSVISEDTIKLTGSVSTFTSMNFPLPEITASVTTPDSVIIVIGTHELDLNGPTGSWIEIDDLQFTGPGVTQTIVNGAFDSWTNHNVETPGNWQMENAVEKTTDAFAGTYAAKLTTVDNGNWVEYSRISQEISLNATVDTLIGYYKYVTTGNDSALVDITVLTSGSPISITKHLQPAATYTQFKIPLVSGNGTTVATIEFYSSTYMMMSPTDGTTLYLDSLMIKPQFVSVPDVAAGNAAIKVYPNPASDVLKIDLKDVNASSAEVAFYDAVGTCVYKSNMKVQSGKELSVPVAQLASGMYIYEIKAGVAVVKDRFVKN